MAVAAAGARGAHAHRASVRGGGGFGLARRQARRVSTAAQADAPGAEAGGRAGAARSEREEAKARRYAAPAAKRRPSRPTGKTVVDERGNKHSIAPKALKKTTWVAPEMLMWVPMERPESMEEYDDFRRSMSKQRNSLQRYGFREPIEVWEDSQSGNYYVAPRLCWRLWAAAEVADIREIPVRIIGPVPSKCPVQRYKSYVETAGGKEKKTKGGRVSKALRAELVGPEAVPPAPSEFQNEWRHTFQPWMQRVTGDFTGEMLSLRGLPFKADRSSIAQWAAEAAADAYEASGGDADASFAPPRPDDVYIPLVNGKRNGSALVRFRSNADARNARAVLHRRDMVVGKRSRYVEAFPAAEDVLERSIDMGYAFFE